jgi:hypothetical protein
MAAPEIEISKDGLKISYQRYLADSAAGFVVILAVLFVVSKGYPLPFFGHSLESLLKLPDNVQLFVFLLLFLLATPIGLFINGLSWFAVGWCRIYLIKFWFKLPEKWYNPLFPTKKAVNYDQLAEFFRINEQYDSDRKSIYELSALHGKFMDLFLQDRFRIEHHVATGLARFIRNMALISFLSLLAFLHVLFWYASDSCIIGCPFQTVFILLFLTVFLAVLYSLQGSFSCLKILSTVYLLCTARSISNEEGVSPQELIKKIHAAYFSEKSGGEN